jgi:asparagine synthase (glutamine-hydrolysing)
MQSQTDRPVRTFSIGYDEPAYDEAPFARAVAQHLDTDHTELVARPADALAVIPRLAALYDEPFADSSQIPTTLLSHLTRQHVKVSLSGDGGDELFAGYEHYLHDARRWQNIQRLPRSFRRWCATRLTRHSESAWDVTLQPWHKIAPGVTGYKLHRLAGALGAADVAAFYRGQAAKWLMPRDIIPNLAKEPWPVFGGDGAGDSVSQMAYFDFHNYLPEDVLAKVDRASMSVALETRVPLLDKRVVSFAFSLPANMKWRNGVSKWLLRQVLYRYVPRILIERPKMGFRVPVAQWLRGPLRDWAEELLSETSLNRSGLLRADPIRRIWQQHQAGTRNWEHLLWIILMYQAWDEEWSQRR